MEKTVINIERAVAKIVGEKCGNAILIDKKHAITVKHCVNNNEQINLVFPKMHNGKEIKRPRLSQKFVQNTMNLFYWNWMKK